MAQTAGNLAEAITLSEQSVDLYRSLAEPWGLAEALTFLGNQTLNRFEPAENGEQFLSESLEIFERLGNRRGVAKALRRLGMHANLHGRAEESETWLRRSLAIYEQMADRTNIAGVLRTLSSLVANNHGRFAEAHSLLAEAMRLAQSLGNRRQIGITGGMLAFMSIHLGNFQQACAEGLAGLEVARAISDPWVISFVLWQLGDIAVVQGDPEQAERYLRESLVIERGADHLLRLHDVLTSSAYTAHAMGRSEYVAQCLLNALRGAVEDRLWFSAVRALPLAALHTLEQDQPERAVELWSMALGYPHVANSAWYNAIVGRSLQAAADTLSPERAAVLLEQGRRRDLWETVAEILVTVESRES